MSPETDETALDLAAEVGAFFVLDRWRPDSGWRPLRELIDDPEVLRERVAAARGMLAGRSGVGVVEIEERATASIVFLGLAARLVSPALAATAIVGRVPQLCLDELWWQPVLGGPWPLARGRLPQAVPGHDLAADFDAVVLQAVVAPLLDALGRTFAVSSQVLWGNVASGLAGALGMLRSARPEHADAATRIVAGLLERGTLAGAGDLGPAGSAFRRRSCCLFYRMPGAGICGDCVLDEAPTPA